MKKELRHRSSHHAVNSLKKREPRSIQGNQTQIIDKQCLVLELVGQIEHNLLIVYPDLPVIFRHHRGWRMTCLMDLVNITTLIYGLTYL